MKKLIVSLVLVTLCCGVWAQKTRLPTPKPKEHLQVVLTGIADGAEKSNVIAALGLDKKGYISNAFKNPRQIQLAADSMTRSIREALSPYGYFQPRVHQYLKRVNKHWVVTYTIHLGPRVVYRNIKLRVLGKRFPKAAEKTLHQKWPIKKGKPFTANSYNAAKMLLTQLANDYGFFNYRFVKSTVEIIKSKMAADVTIIFYIGSRFHFGRTRFKAPTMNKGFLKRFILYKKGKPYLSANIDKTRRGMINSQYFSSVSLVAEPKKSNRSVPVKAELSPAAPHVYSLGAGYGTDTGIRGGFRAAFNHINDHGHRMNFLLRGSRVNSAALVNYIIPGSYPPNDSYTFTAAISNYDQYAGKAFSKNLSAGYTTLLGRWTLTAQLKALHEEYDLLNWPKTNTTLVYPRLFAGYIYSNDVFFPTEGFSFQFETSAANKSMLSRSSYAQFKTGLRFIHSFGSYLRFLMRLEYGYTDVKRLEQIPLTLQLFAGGADSIRGFSYQSIFGGRQLFTGSAELQLKIYKKWYLAGFYDTGNVNNKVFDNPMKIGAGPGIMWVSPVGPVELTFARALSTKTKSWSIQLTVGTFL